MKRLVWVLMLFVGVSYASAQEVYTSSGKSHYNKKVKKKKGYDPDKLIIGGGFTAMFGSGYVNAGLSPIVGYRITNNLSAGIGLGYQYFQEPRDVGGYNLMYARENIVYPNVWTRYFVFRNFFVSAAYEYDLIWAKFPGYDPYSGNLIYKKTNETNSCLLLGVGLRQPLGGRVSFFGELVYDVLQGPFSPYPAGSPDVRIGFAAGL
jgi:hypothetical protein